MVTKWQPPSFDPKPKEPDVPLIPLPTVEEVEAIRQGAYDEGHAAGKADGYTAGRAEGYQAGFAEGRAEGDARAYAEAKDELSQLATALGTLLAALQGLPDAVSDELAALAYQVGLRVSGRETLDRVPFVQAVQEALMRLPRPGETLFLRVRAAEAQAWQKLIDDPGLPFRCTLLIDADVAPGHAFVEVDGARLNIGAAARRALVRLALGLDIDDDSLAERLALSPHAAPAVASTPAPAAMPVAVPAPPPEPIAMPLAAVPDETPIDVAMPRANAEPMPASASHDHAADPLPAADVFDDNFDFPAVPPLDRHADAAAE